MEIKAFIELHSRQQFTKPMKLGKSIHFHEGKQKPKDVLVFSLPELPEFKVEVRLCTFKINKHASVLGIVTDYFTLPRETKIGGGNDTYVTEIRFMREAAKEMLLKHNLMICEEVQSYPFVKLIVTQVTPVHIESYLNKNKINKNHEKPKVRESDSCHLREGRKSLV